MSVGVVWFPDYGHMVAGIFLIKSAFCWKFQKLKSPKYSEGGSRVKFRSVQCSEHRTEKMNTGMGEHSTHFLDIGVGKTYTGRGTLHIPCWWREHLGWGHRTTLKENRHIGPFLLAQLWCGLFLLLLWQGENKVNSYSNQLKLGWVCKFEWSLTNIALHDLLGWKLKEEICLSTFKVT